MEQTTTRFNPTEPSEHVSRWVDTYGVDHSLVDLRLDDIDQTASLRNQARLNPLNKEDARIYRDAMLAGCIFPPLVGYKPESGDVVLIDGNTRYEAAKMAQASSVYVHVVSARHEQILDMIASANATLNGRESTFDERIHHGLRMMAAGTPATIAARQVSVSATALKRHRRVDAVRRRLESLGMHRAAENLPIDRLESMHTVNDEIDRDLALALVGAADVANKELFTELVRDVHKSPTDGRLDMVAQFVEKHRRAVNAKPNQARKMDAWSSFHVHGSGIRKLHVGDVVATLPPERRDEMKRLADDVRALASKLEQAL